MLRWMTPIPPACAIAIASALSVTVSIAAETSGMPSSISRVSRVRVSVSPGMIADAAGTSITSSKVRACRISIGASFPMAAHYTPRTPPQEEIGAGPVRASALSTMIWSSRPFSARQCDAKKNNESCSSPEDWNEMRVNGRMAAGAAALVIAITVAVAAWAEPLTIRIGWVVTPGHMAPLIEALGKREPAVFKHLGQSYVLQPLRFNGTTPQIQAQAIGDLEVAVVLDQRFYTGDHQRASR